MDPKHQEFIEKVQEFGQSQEEYVQSLYKVLFVIFTEFMESDYNGIVRQLLKLFIESIEPVIKKVIRIKDSQKIGFLIAIFENWIVDKKIKRDTFDLRGMRKILITDEQVEKMKLKKSLEGTTICELRRISPPNVKSKHVIICITGFLQED